MGRKAYKKEYVWKWITRAGEDECWLWTGNKSPFGYGEMEVAGTTYRAHRLVYELANNVPLPRISKFSADSQIVMHSCDNPGCCNPKHLFLGSPKQNIDDMVRKGRRHNFDGERGQRAKLTNAQANEVRELCKQRLPQKDIAKQYGISVPTVSSIKWNKVYRVPA